MSIDRLRKHDRRQVAWLGVDPPKDAQGIFEQRNFFISRLDRSHCRDPATLSGLCAVIFLQDEADEKKIRNDIDLYAELFLSFGCTVMVRALETSREAATAILKNRLFATNLPDYAKKAASAWQDPNGDPPTPHVRIYPETVSYHQMANFLAENPPGPAPSSTLAISVCDDHDNEFCGPHFTTDCDLLVRRAFYNCSRVHLIELAGGRSGAGVFRAYPELAKGQSPTSFPQPYFVKIGDRQAITKEYNNYEDWVDPYIPFHLGPHLVHERCCLGAHKGILVGDYVEASEGLLDAARNGRASPALAGLFDRALHGWYRGAEWVDKPIIELLRLPGRIRPVRLSRGRELGGELDFEKLRSLWKQCTARPTLVGPIHGDLHAENVRVRGNDAILIDFAQHRKDPLVYDVASLEASLLIEGFSGEPYWDASKWLRSIQCLYDVRPLPMSPQHVNPRDSVYWFVESVRQLRHHAQRMETPRSNQYAAALAAALIIKGNKDPEAAEPEASRRAGALVMAEMVLIQTFG